MALVAGVTQIQVVGEMTQPAGHHMGALPHVADIGFVIYWFYGRTHSPLASAEEARRRTPLQAVANFGLVFGALGLFNGLGMFLLGLLTELGITTETTAKWAELDALTTRSLGVHVTGHHGVKRRRSTAAAIARYPALFGWR